MTIKRQALTRAALMVALLIVLGYLPAIPVGIIPVPIVLQNMGVMLTAMLLGPKTGSIAVACFVGLALLGLPILAGGRGGIAVAVGPTGGYLLSYLLVPALYGIFGGARSTAWWRQILALVLAGVVVVDLCGALWLSMQSGIPLAAALMSNLVFLPGDAAKTIISVLVARRVMGKNYSRVEV